MDHNQIAGLNQIYLHSLFNLIGNINDIDDLVLTLQNIEAYLDIAATIIMQFLSMLEICSEETVQQIWLSLNMITWKRKRYYVKGLSMDPEVLLI